MKRSEALAPLSRDHHHALVLARDLVQAGPDDAGELGERYARFLRTHETAHFALEESLLLPELPEERAALDLRVREDHAFLREAMTRLAERDPLPETAELHRVGQRLRDHVRMEEQELFPYLEERLSDAQLEGIARRLQARSV